MLLRRYRLSPAARIVRGLERAWLVSHHPLQAVRLDEPAAELLSRFDGRAWLEELVTAVAPAWIDFLDGLTERGFLQAEYRLEPPRSWPPVYVVIPVFDDEQRLERCLGSLRRLDYPHDRLKIMVVDDGSHRPHPPSPSPPSGEGESPARGLGDPGVAARSGAGTDLPLVRWLRLDRNVGPASARNAGVAALGRLPPEALLAFIDSDCVAEPGWLKGIVSAIDPGYDAAGGAVAGLVHDSLLARYEDACSSLNMGARPGRASGKDAPVPYLPTCNLIVRAEAFAAVGGFRAGWRTGEDVDFCWRLADAGRRMFYWPAGRVRHDYRITWRGFLGRRRDYARSEGPLSRIHPRRFAVRTEAWAFDLGLIVLGAAWAWPGLTHGWRGLLATLAAGLVFGPDVVGSTRALRRWPSEAGSLRPRTLAGALGRQALARLLQQSRWVFRHLALPLGLVCLVVPALLPLGIGLGLLGGIGEWLARRPRLRIQEFALGWIAECLAYSGGWLEGMLGEVARARSRARRPTPDSRFSADSER